MTINSKNCIHDLSASISRTKDWRRVLQELSLGAGYALSRTEVAKHHERHGFMNVFAG
jgi:hypothetical protein